MDLRHLRYFVAVAEERHFGRAAKRLRISQPPLSRQIQLLEDELGVQLFTRDRRQVSLTPAGDVLLTHSRSLFRAVDTAVTDTQRANRGELGRLVIGYPSSVVYSGITELLQAFRARLPQVEIALREGPPQETIDALKAGTIDVGFVRAPLRDVGLKAEVIREEQLMVAVPRAHRLARSKTIPLSELADEDFVLFPRNRGPAFHDLIISLCREAGFAPRIKQEAAQLDIISLVEVGLGVSILPGTMRLMGRQGVVFVQIEGDPKTQLLMAHREGTCTPLLKQFLETARGSSLRRV